MDFDAASLGHFVDAGERFEGAEENAAGAAFGFAGNVEAVVGAVNEVNVGMAGRAEQDGIARSLTGGGVGGGIIFAEIGFDFDDAGGQAGAAPSCFFLSCYFSNQHLAEKFAGYATGIAVEEFAIQGTDRGRAGRGF